MPYEVRRRFLEAPTRKETIIFGGLGILAMVGLMAVITDYGTQSPFHKGNFGFWLFWIQSAVVTAKLLINRYRLTRKKP